jgi:hypothetical protein
MVSELETSTTAQAKILKRPLDCDLFSPLDCDLFSQLTRALNSENGCTRQKWLTCCRHPP